MITDYINSNVEPRISTSYEEGLIIYKRGSLYQQHKIKDKECMNDLLFNFP